MTLVQTPAALSPRAEDRAGRLIAAGTAWSERISAETSKAKLTYRVTAAGEGSVATRITAGKHVFLVDEPGALAGDDVAASPVEIALGALLSCQVVVYRLYAQVLGIQVDEIEIAAEGDLDVRRLFGISEDVRAGFSAIRLHITITGPESDERYQELRVTVDAHCPVLDLFANPTPVSVIVTKAYRIRCRPVVRPVASRGAPCGSWRTIGHPPASTACAVKQSPTRLAANRTKAYRRLQPQRLLHECEDVDDGPRISRTTPAEPGRASPVRLRWGTGNHQPCGRHVRGG
ncbi:OsmC family protein [Cryobacterium sp. M25]|uniref:OsmC family protein n=1 Tax=Cryobacterium sp. M25 TaxID=2048293 RepID=UPI000CE2D995|nr:OsmC family protein [Cryobacterium sp. M25]